MAHRLSEVNSNMAEETAVHELQRQDHAQEEGQEKKPPPLVLSESEKNIVDVQLNGLPAGIEAPSLWSYTTTWDKVVIVVSVAAAIIAGALNPLLTVSSQDYPRKGCLPG
jgi:hypothetical protein